MTVSGSMRKHRVAIASNLALLVAAAGIVVVATQADGYRKHEAQLNDGGIWVTNGRDGFHGRINKPIGQLDGVAFAEQDTQLDVVQDGAAVVGLNVSAGVLSTIDPGKVELPDGESARLPSAAQVQLAGATLAVLDPVDGTVWASRVDTRVGVPAVAALDVEAEPLAATAEDASLAVTLDGDVLVASASDDTVRTFARSGEAFAAPTSADLGSDLGPGITVTAVGETAVVLDTESGALQVVGGPDADVPPGSALQVPGPEAAAVLVATPDRLVAIDLVDGGETEVVADVAGRPTPPVRLGACVYGAWSGGFGTVSTRCGDDEPRVDDLGTETTDLVFRVNRDEILLNDRSTGAVWNIDSDQPTRLDNWDAFQQKPDDDDEKDQNENPDQGDRRPPEAKDDDLGARVGRTTVLHPLDNDTAPAGRLLAIVGVDTSGTDAEVTISPDGQTVQVSLSDDAGPTRFDYTIDDGRSGLSDTATVSITPRTSGANALPQLREGFEPTTWTVPSSGTLDVPVLPDWRDREDGDPLSLSSAVAVGGERSGATARTTSGGRVRFTAPVRSGVVVVRYAVTDGIGEPVEDELRFQVQGLTERKAYPGVAEPDVVSGEAGKPVTIRPLGNDLPGSDPVTPNATLRLAGRVAEVGGAEVSTDLVDGSLTFRATQPRTYFLDYDLRYGNAPFAPGRIRVDVKAPGKPPEAPVATPDSVTLYGQAATLVDVLANDIDPTGGLLVVQSGRPQDADLLDVAVVEGRWLRIAVRQGRLPPAPQLVRYTISNGARSGVTGEVVVTQRPEPPDTTPVTEVDRAVVRAGGAVSVPVLDNDFSPTGDELDLVADLPELDAGVLAVQASGDGDVPTGQAFVTDRFVRYLAPEGLEDAETFTIRYLATNAAGERAPGTLEVQVVPRERRNEPPEPPVLEGRVVAGDTVKLTLPGVDVDPDGDPVTLTGIGSAPGLGRIVRYGASSLHFQAYPGSAGTDEFSYTVSDPLGGHGTGTVRIAVVPPGTPQPPLAVPDTLTSEPGRLVRVDPLTNDHVAAGDRVSIDLVGEPEGASLETPQGPLLLEAPADADGRNVEVVYRVTNGIDTSQATVTLRVTDPFNNPPVVFDAFGTPATQPDPDDGSSAESVTVDVLETAYDPDGAPEDLRVTHVHAPAGTAASIDGARVTIERGDQPLVVPFRVKDADGGAATASVFVPPLAGGAPYVLPDAQIELAPGSTERLDLDDYVVNPSGGPVQFTLQDRIWTSPATSLVPAITGDRAFELGADEAYVGPGAVVFEVTTGTSVDDPEGVEAVLSVPVQVGTAEPILRCPEEPVRIAQDRTLDLDIASLCHVWTPDPDDAGGLSFDADWRTSVDGLAIIEPSGPVISVNATGSTTPGSRATLEVTSGGSDPGLVEILVVKSPPPSLAPIRLGDLRAGETRTVDLAPYLTPGVANPEPTVVLADQVSGPTIDVSTEGSEVTLRAGDDTDGDLEIRVVMSDVAGSTGPERQVDGVLRVSVLDVPDAPTAPVPGETIRDQEVLLSWRQPEPNGVPIDRYQLRGTGGAGRECGGTTCEVTGLTNGKDYRFEVRAHNAVGWSEWSPQSAVATPDAKPGRVGPIRMTKEGDGLLRLAWTPPTTQTSDIREYVVSWPGGSATSRRPEVTASPLDNNKKYAFTVYAVNERFAGERRTSAEFQSVGTPGTPAAPTLTENRTSSDETAVVVTWPDVDPNGPTPLRYTVLRDGQALASCTGITASECVDAGIQYDGRVYTYAVRVTNKFGEGRTATGSGSQFQATGEPEPWGDWTLTPTGQNNQARADFTVPDANGARSRVRIYVDGALVREIEATGVRAETIEVPDNDRGHTVTLDVCNEKEACAPAAPRGVQTYGPLTSAQIISVEAIPSDAIVGGVPQPSVAWRVTVDTNGDPARVRVVSSQRDQTFEATGVDVQTFTTSERNIGYSTTESVRVILSDPSPARGEGTASASFRTSGPPEPEITVSRGSRCSDRTDDPVCNRDGTGTDCLHASCGRIQVSSFNFPRNTATCTFYDSAEGAFRTRSVRMNTVDEPGTYFGYPNRSVWVVCDGVESNHYGWPNS